MNDGYIAGLFIFACFFTAAIGYVVGYGVGQVDGFTKLCTTNHGVVIKSDKNYLCVDPKIIEVTK